MYGYVYLTTNKINNKMYIGLRTGKFNPHYMGSGVALKRAVKKYGKHAFSVQILEWCDDKSTLQNKEIEWIHRYDAKNSSNFYNLTDGIGYNGWGCVTSEITRKKIKENHSTPEYKNDISTKLKKFYSNIDNYNRIYTPERRKEISISHTGRQHIEESKQKIADKLRGVSHPWQDKVNKNPEKIRKTAETHRGMKRSKETRRLISESKKGKPSSIVGRKQYYCLVERTTKFFNTGEVIPDGFLPGTGKLWCRNPVNKETRYVWVDILPDGFVKGRVEK